MPEGVVRGFAMLPQALEIAAAGALALGFVIVTGRWFLQTRREGFAPATQHYRKALGRVILVALELLVAATIVKTVIMGEPTLEGVSKLAIMVAIRTFLGWATVVEMTGRWPWQSPQFEAAGESAG